MCKLLTFTSLKNLKNREMERLTKAVSAAMAKTERDGFGLTLITDKGIGARKFTNPKSASLNSVLHSAPFLDSSAEQLGEIGTKYKSIIFHGRTSTNYLGLVNTHPIIKHGLWLSHNGVVEDSGPKYEAISNNDTEHLVERISQGVEQVEKYISGHYATIHYKEGSESTFIMRDSIAPLVCAFIESLDGYCIATNEGLVKAACGALGLSYSNISDVMPNIAMELNGSELLAMSEIKPKGRTSYTDSLSAKSLGRSMDTISQDWSWDYDSRESAVDDAIELFLDESEMDSDSSWVFALNGLEISRGEFLDLHDDDRLNCVVIRSDGTLCSPGERNGLFYDGALPHLQNFKIAR